MCWENPEQAGTFDSKKAIEIGDALCQFIFTEIEERKKMSADQEEEKEDEETNKRRDS